MATKKKVTHVNAAAQQAQAEGGVSKPVFVPTEEHKKKATTNRIIAVILWVLAIAAEIAAIIGLGRYPDSLVPAIPAFALLIILIVIDLALAVTGNILWKKANRLDPASEKDKARFFIQNQLGAFIAAIAFIPLLILLLMNKNISGKQKGILTAIVAVCAAGAIFSGIDFNPPSQEQYAAETDVVQQLTGQNQVYWTKSGQKYHLYDDCYTINTDKTTEIFQGTVADCHADKNITELCKVCEKKALKDPNLPASQLSEDELEEAA